MSAKLLRRLAIGGLILFGGAALIEVLAWANVFYERRKRAYLGDQLFVARRGEGTPLILLAGLEGSARYWPPEFLTLADRHRLLMVDTLGFGRSPWPLRQPTLEDHLQWLHRTLVAEGATAHVTIVAHSFGAIVAAYYAARYPEEVDHLVLLGTPVFRGEADARRRIRAISALGGLFSLNAVVAREACLLMGATRPLLRAILPALSRRFPPEVVEDSILHDWPSIHGAIQNVLLRSPIEPALQQVRAHILFIHGREDGVTALARVRELAERLHASLLPIAGDHHSYVTTSRDAVVAAVQQLPTSAGTG